MKLKLTFILWAFLGPQLLLTQSMPPSAYAPDQIILKLKTKIDPVRFLEKVQSRLQQGNLAKKNIHSVALAEVFQNQPTAISLPPALRHVYRLTLPGLDNFKAALATVAALEEVIYAQLNYLHQIDQLPDDPLYSEQWGLSSIQIESAWEITRGKPDVLITVIDTGIDYQHEDLQGNIWINPAEDLNNNSQFDLNDLNGIDDDQNGFIDDIQGWDFTDAPAYPDNGDYLTPDHDPMDEHGHGTAIAGIVAAVGNNYKGVIGVAPDCRILNLRAGTSRGLLEEDDVAAAIVYAVLMGSRIINMSFGDKVASPLLHDVISFAYENDCILIASAGNSASDSTHYPSGFAETIAVGAITQADILASYSNFGSTLDVVAPGVNIFSTDLNNNYRPVGGTSAASPFVAGVSALLLSQNPQLSNEAIRGILMSTATDLGTAGWDAFFGAGKINATQSLRAETATIVKIASPHPDQGIQAEQIVVSGTVAGASLASYSLHYGEGINPEKYTEILQVQQRQVVNDSLGNWNLAGLPDTTYTLRLTLTNYDGSQLTDQVIVLVDHSPPEISALKMTPMLDQEKTSILLEFYTDDVCETTLFFRQQNSNEKFRFIDFEYITQFHRLNISQAIISSPVEFYLRVTNRSGLTTIDDNSGDFYLLDLSAPPISTSDYVFQNIDLPAGYLLGKASDFDQDGQPEIILNEYTAKKAYGPLKIFETSPTGFQEVFATSNVALPRDWGDSDGDGKMEILAHRGNHSFIWEAPAPKSFPTKVVWSDTNDCWVTRFSDLDADGRGEIIARVHDTYVLFETVGDNQFALVDSFPNVTPGTNGFGVPHAEIADFDGDGWQEILCGDYDGDLFIYENNGNNRFRWTWSQRLPLMDATDYLAAGDFNGDGVVEFAAGCHSNPDLDLEHEYDSRYWHWRIYQAQGDNNFAVVWQENFYGFFPPRDFDSGCHAADYDQDGRDELLLILFPDIYLIDYDDLNQAYQVAWYYSPGQSNTAVLLDKAGDDQPEFLLNNGTQLIGFQSSLSTAQLAAPLGLSATILDTNRVELSWLPVTEATGYRVFRGPSAEELFKIIDLEATYFFDSAVTIHNDYFYAVSALSGREPSEVSRPSPPIKIHLSERPYLTHAQALSPQQLRLEFSEPMNETIRKAGNYQIEGEPTRIRSVALAQSGQAVILTTSEPLAPGQTFLIQVNQVFDLDQMPIDTSRNQVLFQVKTPVNPPYLIQASLENPHQIKLLFNETIETSSGENITHYQISPQIEIQAAYQAPDAPEVIYLNLVPGAALGAYGENYQIKVRQVKNLAGIPIQPGIGDQVSLVFYKRDLSEIMVFPNPCNLSVAEPKMTFINLTRQAQIKILNLSGKVLKTLEETDGNGGVSWDLIDNNGRVLPAGIYLYYVTSEKESKVGKFAVIK